MRAETPAWGWRELTGRVWAPEGRQYQGKQLVK